MKKENKKTQKNSLPELSKADLHIHTSLSDGKPSVEEVLDWVHSHTDLSVIAITDHDEIEGGYIAQKIVKEKGYDIEIVIGEEVTAKEGHVLGLFIKEKVKPGMTARETIQEIHKQGGLAVAAHPFFQTRLRSPLSSRIDGVGAIALIKESFDALEVANATPFFTAVKEGQKAKYLNRKLLQLAELGGSDSHTKEAVGVAATIFEGTSAKDLRQSIEKKETGVYRGGMSLVGKFWYIIYFVIPYFFRISFLCFRRGFASREPDIIRLPKDFK
jgi:hypothetical protein